MNCGLYRTRLIEVARGGKPQPGSHPEPRLAAHLHGCPGCAKFLADQRRLSVAVRDLAVRANGAVLPRGLESELLAEFEAVRTPVAQPRFFWLSAGALAMAAALMAIVVHLRTGSRDPKAAIQVVASVAPPVLRAPIPETAVPAPMGFRPVTVPPRPLRPVRTVPARPAEPEEMTFVSIPYTMPLAPDERANVVRMDVPVSALIAAGLPMRVSDMSANASADVLVGEDGRARAVRLISVSDSNFNRSYK